MQSLVVQVYSTQARNPQGRTRTLNFYRVGADPGSLILVDAPGYGGRGRPEWGEVFDYYVKNRKELRRIFILFNAKHGLNDTDRLMLQSLDERCQESLADGRAFTLQGIITKADKQPLVGAIKKIQQDIFDAAPSCLPAIVTTAQGSPFFGVEEVRKSIVDACGIGKFSSIRT